MAHALAFVRAAHAQPQGGEKIGDQKSPAGKTDYHTMGACQDVLAALGVRPPETR